MPVITVVSRTSDSVDLKIEFDDTDTYEISYGTDSTATNGSKRPRVKVGSSSTLATVDSLSSKTQYFFQVKALDSAGNEIAKSDIVEAWTILATPKIITRSGKKNVNQISNTDPNATSQIQVKWEPVADAVGYEFWYVQASEDEDNPSKFTEDDFTKIKSADISGTSVTIKNLKINKGESHVKIYVKVKALAPDGSPYGDSNFSKKPYVAKAARTVAGLSNGFEPTIKVESRRIKIDKNVNGEVKRTEEDFLLINVGWTSTFGKYTISYKKYDETTWKSLSNSKQFVSDRKTNVLLFEKRIDIGKMVIDNDRFAVLEPNETYLIKVQSDFTKGAVEGNDFIPSLSSTTMQVQFVAGAKAAVVRE